MSSADATELAGLLNPHMSHEAPALSGARQGALPATPSDAPATAEPLAGALAEAAEAAEARAPSEPLSWANALPAGAAEGAAETGAGVEGANVKGAGVEGKDERAVLAALRAAASSQTSDGGAAAQPGESASPAAWSAWSHLTWMEVEEILTGASLSHLIDYTWSRLHPQAL